MKEDKSTKAWIQAGRILGTDPTLKVNCPVCGLATLVVTDITVKGTDKFERIMRCPNCGSRNILLMRS
jgi:hypothetical protein